MNCSTTKYAWENQNRRKGSIGCRYRNKARLKVQIQKGQKRHSKMILHYNDIRTWSVDKLHSDRNSPPLPATQTTCVLVSYTCIGHVGQSQFVYNCLYLYSRGKLIVAAKSELNLQRKNDLISGSKSAYCLWNAPCNNITTTRVWNIKYIVMKSLKSVWFTRSSLEDSFSFRVKCDTNIRVSQTVRFGNILSCCGERSS